MVQQLALVCEIAMLVADSVISSATQIKIRIVETADVSRYLLEGQVNLLFVADEIVA